MFFFFNDTATTEIYTLPLHDALPIFRVPVHVVIPTVGAHREILGVAPQPAAVAAATAHLARGTVLAPLGIGEDADRTEPRGDGYALEHIHALKSGCGVTPSSVASVLTIDDTRLEERRVGKECKSR